MPSWCETFVINSVLSLKAIDWHRVSYSNWGLLYRDFFLISVISWFPSHWFPLYPLKSMVAIRQIMIKRSPVSRFNALHLRGFFVGVFLFFLSPLAFAVPQLSLGPFGPGLIDGSEPFNTFGVCADANDALLEGEDCGESNGVVRSQDTVVHIWSVTADEYDLGADNLTDVVLEQTITPSTNAAVIFESLPAICKAENGAGTNPPSGIVEHADGSSTLTCNLGEYAEGQQKSVTVNVKVSGNSYNGSEYISSQRVYSLDSAGAENATGASYADIGPIKISARPAYDLIRSISPTQGFYNMSVSYRALKDLDGDGTPDSEPGFITYGLIRIAAETKSGIESIEQPIVFQDTFTAKALAVDGADYPLEMYVTECRDNPTGWGGEVFGRKTYYSSYDNGSYAYHASDSGSCTYTRNNPADPTSLSFTVTIDNADFSGTHYPTKAFGNVDLTSGPYYVTNHRVQYWIPFRSIDMTDGVMDDQGSVYLSSLLSDFEPVSLSGVSNYGTDTEPGYNGADMDNGQRSNNILGPTNYYLTVRGSFNKRNAKTFNNGTGYSYAGTSWHGGDGEVEPGQGFAGFIHFVNNGTKAFPNPMACDVFDNTVLQLTDRSNVGATVGTYAYLSNYKPAGFEPANYQIEYGHVDLTGDDPIDADHDGNADYDVSSGRYLGDWSVARALRCDDDVPVADGSGDRWFSDPAQVPGGIDAVNIVRVRLTDTAAAASVEFEPGQQMWFIIPTMVRDTFNGGPHAGEEIPVGSVLANFGSVRADNWNSGWSGRNYAPSPETGNTDGDRVTLVRIRATLDSESLQPVATSGNQGITLAGNQVVWKVSATVQSSLADPSDASNLHIIDVLPPEASYNADCTLALADGTPPSLVEYNTDKDGNPAPGYTRLIWNFGDFQANTEIAPRIFCTDTDPLAPDGTAVVNYAEIRADNIITALSVRSDMHTIKLEQTGSIQVAKSVDMPLDGQNDTQVYEISWANFAPAFTIDPPVIIDVFSHMSGGGDGDGLSARRPTSDFHGDFYLTAAPSISWLDDSVPSGSDPHAEIGVWYYTVDAAETINYNPDSNTSNWCLEADFGTAGCPANFSDVTAIKFVSNYVLEKDGNPRQGMKATYIMQAGDPVDNTSSNINLPGDIYTNRFVFDSTSLPADQFLRSNNVSVQIAAFSIGDFIFADVNGNGVYEANIDGVVPDGVVVELYGSDDIKRAETSTGLLAPGRYLFEPLPEGDYYIRIPASEFQPGGKLEDWQLSPLTGSNAENNDLNEVLDQHGYSDISTTSSGVRTGVMTLSANPPPPGGVPTGNEPTGDNVYPILDPTGDDFSNLTLDIGLQPVLSTLGNMVWQDSNNNGTQDVGESGLSNVTVNLLDSSGNQIATTRTDNDGYYQFADLVAGNYIIEVEQAAGYVFAPKDNVLLDDSSDSDVDTATGQTDVISLAFNQNQTQWDAGLYQLGSIGDRLWQDNNVNAGQDAGELSGMANVTVNLLDSSNTVIATTQTDANGNYLFSNLPAGTYTVDVDATDTDLNGYALTTANDPYSINLSPEENYRDADFGYVQYASVGDKVWHDSDGNGIQDGTESGIAGVTVRLLNTAGSVIVQTTTDASGNYLFNNVIPSDYVLEFVKPSDYSDFVTNDLGADDGLDSDVIPATGRTGIVNLTAGQNRTDIDAGLYQTASLGNLLWLDVDGNALQGVTEPGLSGISVSLNGVLGNGDTFAGATSTTDANGQYQFSGLYPGNYTITFNTSGFVTANQGSDDALDSDANAGGEISETLASGENNQTLDAGIIPAAVMGRVWIDSHTQNALDESNDEAGLVGVGINLIDVVSGNVVVSTTTGVDGLYRFDGVVPGSYLVEVIEPANMHFVQQDQGSDDTVDSDVNQSNGRSEPFTLAAGQTITDIDAGIEPGSLGDRVSLDWNENGLQDAGEPGVAGITVNLKDISDNTVASTVTDSSGFYDFSGVTPSQYTVNFVLPAGMSFAAQDSGSDDTIDFDMDSNGDVSVTVISGQSDQSIDAGIIPATLGDIVWFDANDNGIQDNGEPGVANIPVSLLDASGNILNDVAGTPRTVTTDADGHYAFKVLPGTYAVQVSLSNGLGFVTQNVGTDTAVDSDVDITDGRTSTVTLTSGTADNTLDAGIQPAIIQGAVLLDINGNASEDTGETGIASVSVTLSGTDVLGNAVSMSTTTDTNGAYQFNVMPGTYTITEANPANYTSSGSEAGTLGSTIVNSDQLTVSLNSGEISAQNDFLDYQTASLSGQVREDLNADGDLNESNDTGIAGVTITLWQDITGDGQADVQFASTVTDTGGNYEFMNVPPGNYIVIEQDAAGYQSTADTSTANDNQISITLTSGENSSGHDFLDTYPVNIQGQVRNDEDSDADISDAEQGIETVAIQLYTDPNGDGDPADGALVASTSTDSQGNYQFNSVTPGQYVLVETDPVNFESTGDIQGDNDNRISLTLSSSTDSVDNDFLDTTLLGSLSGMVWIDANVDELRNSGTENGLAGIRVYVMNSAGVTVATLTTDTNGAYQATDLDAGDYTISIDVNTLPEDFIQTADVDSLKNHQTTATVTEGNDTAGLDFGYVDEIFTLIDLNINKTVNNPQVWEGDNAVFNLRLINEGHADATDVMVSDQLPVNLRFSSFTSTQGNYDAVSGLWNVGDLLSGESAELSITTVAE